MREEKGLARGFRFYPRARRCRSGLGAASGAALADEPAEHVLETNAYRDGGANVLSTACAECTGDLDGSASLAALCERDGICARFIRETLPRGTFGSIQRGASRALTSLLPKLRISDANATDELHELERELICDEFVVRQ
jgi:hypothetical protein